MTSTLTLYYGTLLKQSRNFLLDVNGAKGIETYLQTIAQKSIINNFQYVKQALNLTIKLDMSQTGLNMGSGSQDLNYVKIQNGSENPCYYFVTSKTWRSQNTIELVLAMDTLNTYQYNGDYTIDKKTFIKRQHKDRFRKTMRSTIHVEWDFTGANQLKAFDFHNLIINNSKPTNLNIVVYGNASANGSILSQYGVYYITIAVTSTSAGHVDVYVFYDVEDSLTSIIDLKSEEISVPLYKIRDRNLYEKNKPMLDWSLYYKNSSNQANSPVDCFLIPSEDITIKVQQNSGTFDANNIPNGKYLIFFYRYNSPSITFNVDGTKYAPNEVNTSAGGVSVMRQDALALFNDNGTIKVYWASFNNYGSGYGQFSQIASSPTTLKVENSPEIVYSYETDSLPSVSQVFNNQLYTPIYAQHSTSMGAYVDSTLYSNRSIDKTLSTNIKLINIPYSPTKYEIIGGVYEFESCWTFNSADGKLKLTDFNKRFTNIIETNESNIMYPLFRRINAPIYGHPDITIDLNRTFGDPKLYHSDYYRNKFVYDSFSKVFALEQISETESSLDLYFSFEFVMSRNIVSKFLFKFNQYKYAHSMEDYEDVLPVSRNNEEVLYSSQYLDYLRSGYNYDLKSKERQQQASGIGIGLNVAGLVASALAGAVTGNPIAVGGAIASGIGLASQLVSYAKNTAQNEENIQRKLQETQMQSIAVQNADDYDLLYAYTQNKAKLVLYQCSSKMRDVLDDLFFYCGYVVNEQGIPNISSRRSFNFLQASLEVSATNNLTSEILDDIKEKFENGVTFLHYSFNKFDFAQDKENIELSLLS